MAEKLSDSIRRKVKGLRKVLEGGPKDAPAPKASTAGAGAKASDPAGAATPAAKPAKAKPQPWYRHRQRW
ncbi:MAG: hypothetical protein WBO23_07315 [Burkholderiales bacterium]